MSQAQELLELAEGLELFHTAGGEAYAWILVGNHAETWNVKSSEMRSFLRHSFFAEHKKPPSKQAVADAIDMLDAKAQFDGSQREVFLRVASIDDIVYVDLVDSEWRVVEITRDGWTVLADPPVRLTIALCSTGAPQR